jgi:hypothetical protein
VETAVIQAQTAVIKEKTMVIQAKTPTNPVFYKTTSQLFGFL